MTIPDEPSEGETRRSDVPETLRTEARRAAHRRWVERTTAEPASEEAWLGRAETGSTLEEKITALNRALALNPANEVARQAMHACMRELLRRDPQLNYRGESSGFYQVRTAGDFEFAHPKNRQLMEAYPPARSPVVHSTYRWLLWSVVGLLPAGLGTAILAPVAAFSAASLLQLHLNKKDERRLRIAIFGAALLWLLSLGLVFILVLHVL